jgi:hypothetical protein
MGSTVAIEKNMLDELPAETQGGDATAAVNRAILVAGGKSVDPAESHPITTGIDPKKPDTISCGQERPVDRGRNGEALAKRGKDLLIPLKWPTSIHAGGFSPGVEGAFVLNSEKI